MHARSTHVDTLMSSWPFCFMAKFTESSSLLDERKPAGPHRYPQRIARGAVGDGEEAIIPIGGGFLGLLSGCKGSLCNKRSWSLIVRQAGNEREAHATVVEDGRVVRRAHIRRILRRGCYGHPRGRGSARFLAEACGRPQDTGTTTPSKYGAEIAGSFGAYTERDFICKISGFYVCNRRVSISDRVQACRRSYFFLFFVTSFVPVRASASSCALALACPPLWHLEASAGVPAIARHRFSFSPLLRSRRTRRRLRFILHSGSSFPLAVEVRPSNDHATS